MARELIKPKWPFFEIDLSGLKHFNFKFLRLVCKLINRFRIYWTDRDEASQWIYNNQSLAMEISVDEHSMKVWQVFAKSKGICIRFWSIWFKWLNIFEWSRYSDNKVDDLIKWILFQIVLKNILKFFTFKLNIFNFFPSYLYDLSGENHRTSTDNQFRYLIYLNDYF